MTCKLFKTLAKLSIRRNTRGNDVIAGALDEHLAADIGMLRAELVFLAR